MTWNYLQPYMGTKRKGMPLGTCLCALTTWCLLHSNTVVTVNYLFSETCFILDSLIGFLFWLFRRDVSWKITALSFRAFLLHFLHHSFLSLFSEVATFFSGYKSVLVSVHGFKMLFTHWLIHFLSESLAIRCQVSERNNIW